MSQELFGRRVTFSATSGGTRKAWTAGRELDLDITFSIKKTAGSEPNEAEITIWNLSEDSRRFLSDSEDLVVELSCGYEGTEALVFRGDADDVRTSMDGPADRPTVLSCSDGGDVLRSTVMNISSGRDSGVADAISDVLDQLGVPQGVIESASGALKQGVSYLGRAGDFLDDLVEGAGLRWSVQDGEVRVHTPEGTSESVIVLSVDSGMVGIPERLVERDQAEDVLRSGVRVRSLLQPQILPGRRIKVVSGWVSGIFVSETVTHTGTTFGGEWYTDVEAF